MKAHSWLKNWLGFVVLLFSLMGTSSCAQPAELLPRIWIDSPTDGALIPTGMTVNVISHAYARQGIAEVVLTINGQAYRRDAPSAPGAEYVQVNQDWLPTADGVYAVQVQAYDLRGQVSNLASITVRVAGEATAVITPPLEESQVSPTLVVTHTPVETVTPVITVTPLLPQQATIQFWAEPSEIQAGACTTIRWHVENAARVVFGGMDQPFDGSYGDCMCKSQRYTLTVIQLDGSEVKRTVEIAVNGVCETPTSPPPQDNTPPPAPSPAVPSNGLTLSCRANQTLAWLPVDDPSGITGYYVKLEQEITKGDWRSAGGYGPINSKQVDANVQCGGIYRWMVRAQDGAGNFSNWSAPSYFSINLD